MAEFLGVIFVSPGEYMQYRNGVVVTEGGRLNIRERPSLDSPVLAQIPNGQQVSVYCSSGLWYVIEYNGVLGFVSSRYVNLVE